LRKRTVRRQWELVNPVEHAIGRAARMPQHEIDEQTIPLSAACTRMAQGTWDANDWLNVREAANRVHVLMSIHSIPPGTFLTEVGLVLSAIGDRLGDKGTKALRAEEIKVIRWVEESYAEVLATTTRGNFATACHKVTEAMRAAYANSQKEVA
jgi:hypothetical protein